MKVSRHRLATLLARRSMAAQTDAKDFSRKIAAYLLDTGRTGELEPLLRDIAQERAAKGFVEVMVICAHDLSPEVRGDIERIARTLYPASRLIIVSERRDATVIGGVRLEFIDRQLDLTVRSKLNRFKYLTMTERTVA